MRTRSAPGADRVETCTRRVTGPALLLLDGRFHAPSPGLGDSLSAGAESLREIRFETLSTMTDDDDHLPATGLERRAYGIVDEGSASDGVEHLGQGALHPGALTRG